MSLRHFVVQEEKWEKGPEGHGQGGVRDLTARWGYQARSNLVPGEYMSMLVSSEIFQCSNIVWAWNGKLVASHSTHALHSRK